jgi:hypothetical protein
MSKISLWEGYHRKIEDITIDDFLNRVKYGHWKESVEHIRTLKTKDEIKAAKEKVPAATISGTFENQNRKQDSIITHSGFLCVDIDNQGTEAEQLKNDQYTYAFFKSISGKGAAIIVKINPEKHKESYQFLSEYYFVQYGLVVDEAPKNPASLRFVSYDPDLFVNEKAVKSKFKTEKRVKPKSIPFVTTEMELDKAVQQIMDKGINLAESYQEYLTLGFALANGYDERGRAYFHTLCSMSAKYRTIQADKQYSICLKGAQRSGITVGSFWYMVKQAGIEFDYGRKKDLMNTAAVAKKSGRQKEAVIETFTTINGCDPAEAKEIVEAVFSRSDIDVHQISKDAESVINSLVEYVDMNYHLKRNTITGKIEESGTELRAERINTIYLHARMFFNNPGVTMELLERILYSEMVKDFNPFEDYFQRNSHRKQGGQIDAIIRSIKTPTPMADVFIRKWLISIIAAIDGHPVRSVLSLVGGQNTGKTEWFRRLLPDALKKYYAESKMDSGKDDEILMCQKLIVMDDEMGGKSKQDEKRFKELTSKAVFSLRAPYARHNEDYKRLAVLCGTSNDSNVVNDSTGNTRILPVTVEKIDHDLYNSVSKDELFMELYRAYNSGEQWQLTKTEMESLQEVSREYENIPYERELIAKFYAPYEPGIGYFGTHLTATEIKTEIESYTKQQIRNMQKFGVELKNVLGNSTQKKVRGVNQRYYHVVRVTDAMNPQNAKYEEDVF